MSENLCTDENRAQALLLIRGGASRESAAGKIGVHPDTLRGWIRRGKGGEEPYALFRAQVLEAEATRDAKREITIDKAAAEDWRAAAYALDRIQNTALGSAKARLLRLQAKKLRLEIAALELALKTGDPDKVLSPEDREFVELLKQKWGAARQGTPTTKDPGDGRAPAE